MSLNCDQIRERLHDRLDDQLDAAALREVESHLAGCEHCRKVAEALEETRALMAELQGVTAPAGFAASVGEAIRRTPQEAATRPSRWRSPGPVLASLSMAAGVLFLAALSAPYLGDSRVQREPEAEEFLTLESKPAMRKTDAGPAAKQPGERAPGITMDGETGPSGYAGKGGTRNEDKKLRGLAENEEGELKKLDEAVRGKREQLGKLAAGEEKQSAKKGAPSTGDGRAWGADGGAKGEPAEGGEAHKENAGGKNDAKGALQDELAKTAERLKQQEQRNREEMDRDAARADGAKGAGPGGPPSGGAAAPSGRGRAMPPKPAAPTSPSAPAKTEKPRPQARPNNDPARTGDDADPEPAKSKAGRALRRSGGGAADDEGEPKADSGAEAPSKKRFAGGMGGGSGSAPGESERSAGEKQRKSKAKAAPAAPGAPAPAPAPNPAELKETPADKSPDAPAKDAEEKDDAEGAAPAEPGTGTPKAEAPSDEKAEEKAKDRNADGRKYRSRAGHGAAQGGDFKRSTPGGFVGAVETAPDGEVVLLVAKVAPDSPQARRLLAFLGANAIPERPVLADRQAELARKDGEDTKDDAKNAKDAPADTRRAELEKLLGRLRVLQKQQQKQAGARPAQRGSTVDARLPAEVWNRLNRGVLATMGLKDLVTITSERTGAPAPPAAGPAGPGAPAPQPGGAGAKARPAPVKVVRVLVVFEPAPAKPAPAPATDPESKGK